MINKILKTLCFLLVLTITSAAQTIPKTLQLAEDPWTPNQLMEPSELASTLTTKNSIWPLIYNIGVVENIKGAKKIGASSEKEKLEKFKKIISSLAKNSSIVVYCGCCPFDKCPNIRPAFIALQAAGLRNGKLLNLPTNIKVDWINKGFPMK